MSTEINPYVEMPVRTKDDKVMMVEVCHLRRSRILSDMFTDILEMKGGLDGDVPIPNVTQPILKKIIEWCEHHRQDPYEFNRDDEEIRKKTEDIDEWHKKFMEVDQETLFDIILAANYLDIQPLLDLGCRTVANMIKGKSPEEIRSTFNIEVFLA